MVGPLSICRPVGIIAAPFLVIEIVLNLQGALRERIRALWPLILIPIPMLMYIGHLWWLTGDPLAYFHAKTATNELYLANPVKLIAWNLWRGIRYRAYEHGFNALLVAVATLAIILNGRRIGWNQVLLSFAVVYFPLFSNVWLLSSSRYLAVIFPIYSGLAILADRYRCDDAVSSCLLLLQAFVMIGWVTGLRFLV
jgi:hypothetical protein